MVRPAVYSFDDSVSGALELVMQASRDEAPQHLIGGGFSMQSEPRDIRFAASAGQRPVHRLDDVAADRKVTQRLFQTGLQRPGGRADRLGESQPLEFLRAAKHQPA